MEVTTMEIDAFSTAGLVAREVASEVRDGRVARVGIAARSFNTTLDDLWDALTNTARIPRWFQPVSGDLRLGGRYQIEGNAAGTITACDAPRFLAATWEYGEDVSWIEVELVSQNNDTTLLRLKHVAHVDDERWEQYGPGAVGVGWD